MLDVTDRLLFRPAAEVRAPHELAEVRFDIVAPGAKPLTRSGSGGNYAITYDDFEALARATRDLGQLAGYQTSTLSLGRDADARPVKAAFVTASFFPLLGTVPALGRFFSDDGIAAASAPTAVISSALWRTYFGGDPTVLGRTVVIGKGTFTIVGVARPGFKGFDYLNPMDVWLPIGTASREWGRSDDPNFFSNSQFVRVIGRQSIAQGSARFVAKLTSVQHASFSARLGWRMGPGRTVATLAPTTRGLQSARTGDISVALWLTGISVLVLLISCANAAGLLLLRVLDRRRETAVRLALGANPFQLSRLFWIEAILLALAGGCLGFLGRQYGVAVVRLLLLPQLDGTIPESQPIFDLRTLAVTGIVTAVAAVVSGLAPSLYFKRKNITGMLSGSADDGRLRPLTGRSLLLTGQVALATALVASAILFGVSWSNVRDIQLGFNPSHTVVARVRLQSVGISAADREGRYERMADNVRSLPGVRVVSRSAYLPFVNVFPTTVLIPGVDPEEVRHASYSPIGPEFNIVGPDFFLATGTSLLSGRRFSSADVGDAEPVAIVNTKMTRTFWPHGSALGQCIVIQSGGIDDKNTRCRRIVGIVSDTKSTSIRDDADIQIYAPLHQIADRDVGILSILVDGDPAAAVPAVRRAVADAGHGLPFAEIEPLEEYLEPELRPWRLGAAMFTLFGSVALGLATIGVYATFSYVIAKRQKEFGLRIALGARADDILFMLVRESLVMASVGIAFGLIMALALGRVMSALLVGVTATSPLLLGAAAIVTCAIVVAVVLPAWRAIRVDPISALREA